MPKGKTPAPRTLRKHRQDERKERLDTTGAVAVWNVPMPFRILARVMAVTGMEIEELLALDPDEAGVMLCDLLAEEDDPRKWFLNKLPE